MDRSNRRPVVELNEGVKNQVDPWLEWNWQRSLIVLFRGIQEFDSSFVSDSDLTGIGWVVRYDWSTGIIAFRAGIRY